MRVAAKIWVASKNWKALLTHIFAHSGRVPPCEGAGRCVRIALRYDGYVGCAAIQCGSAGEKHSPVAHPGRVWAVID